ncbi:MAG: HD-GYP domain-containing protein [Thiogranum sp.]|jgi:HD-GYP domain-containing protein (c-di-GMP phosphodiesterase class II)
MSTVEQKISVHDVETGMYISRLDRPWLETRYLFQGFHITSKNDIRELCEQCEYVYVDPHKGVAPRQQVRAVLPTDPEERLLSVFQAAEGQERYPVVTTVEEEVKACREIRRDTVKLVAAILDDIRAGRNIKIATVRSAVSNLMGSVIRNPDAFSWLTRLKSADEYAYAHCIDACGLAMTFGRHLGFSPQEIENLGVGALLFDIGKLQLPEGLLKKPGRLTDSEFAIVRRHVEFGARMVHAMPGSSTKVVSIVWYHHERHDGSGYPRRARGNDIPVKGRIAALVDCYDAITSERPYGTAMSAHDAVRLIYEWRGKDFQADMVEQFIQCIGLYPTGTLVELSTGEVGLVMAQNRLRRLSPKIMLVLDKNKVAYEFNPTLDLIEAPVDDQGSKIEIVRSLAPGTYGIHAADFYL